MRRVALMVPLGLLVGTACSARDVNLGLPPEAIDAGAVSYVVLIEDISSGQVEIAEGRPVEGGSVRVTLDSVTDKRIRLLAYPKTLDKIGLVAGTLPRDRSGGGAALPDPESLWQTALDEDDPAWERIDELSTSEIAFRRPAEAVNACLAFEGSARPWEIGTLPLTNLLGAVALSDDRLLIGGHRYLTPEEGVLGFANFLVSYEPLAFPFASPRIEHLERVGDQIFGTTRTELFELDPDTGALVRSATVPDGAWQLRVGVDQTAVMFDALGAQSRWVDLETLSTRPVQSPVEFLGMYAVSSTLAFGGVHGGIYLFDGQRWRLETSQVTGAFQEFFGDGAKVGALFNGETIYLRDTTGRWNEMPRVVQGLAGITHAVFMADDRIIAAGDGGLTFGWTGEVWCDILTGIQRATRGIVVTPDRRTAFIHSFAENSAQRAPLIRVQARPAP